MAEQYALFIDGVFERTDTKSGRPVDIPHKNVTWYPVGDKVEGETPGWSIVNGEAIETVTMPLVYTPHVVLKTDIWQRMTDGEAQLTQQTLDTMKADEPKLYRLFEDATQLDHNEPNFFPILRSRFVTLFGEEKTITLLEPTL